MLEIFFYNISNFYVYEQSGPQNTELLLDSVWSQLCNVKHQKISVVVPDDVAWNVSVWLYDERWNPPLDLTRISMQLQCVLTICNEIGTNFGINQSETRNTGLVSLGNYNCNYKLNAYRIWVMISRDKIACANSFSFLEGYIESKGDTGNMFWILSFEQRWWAIVIFL